MVEPTTHLGYKHVQHVIVHKARRFLKSMRENGAIKRRVKPKVHEAAATTTGPTVSQQTFFFMSRKSTL